MASRVLAVHKTKTHIGLATATIGLRSIKINSALDGPTSPEHVAEFLRTRSWDRVIASLPAENAFFRILDFPFKDRRRLEMAVASALEEHVPASLDDGHTVFDAERHSAAGRVLAALAAKTSIREHLEELADLGVTPDRLVWAPPATLEPYRAAAAREGAIALDVSHDGAVLGALKDGVSTGLRIIGKSSDDMLLRNLAWTLGTLETDARRVIVGGSRVDSLGRRLTEALSDYDLTPLGALNSIEVPPNATAMWKLAPTLLGLVLTAAGRQQGPVLEFPVDEAAAARSAQLSDDNTPWKSIAPWAAVAGLMFLVSAGVDYARVNRNARQLEASAETVFKKAMPPGSSGPGYRTKMELRLAELERRQAETRGSAVAVTPLAVLASMSSVVPTDIDVQFETYDFKPPKVRITGSGASFEAVTRLQHVLQSTNRFADVQVRDVRSAVSGAGVQFELSLTLPNGSTQA